MGRRSYVPIKSRGEDRTLQVDYFTLSSSIAGNLRSASLVALQLGEEPLSPYGFSSQRCHICLRSDPLLLVMERLSKPGVRRLIVVEAGSRRVEGIIALSNIFRFLLG